VKHKARKEAFMSTQFPVWTKAMDKRIGANSSPHYAVGNKITIADFAIA
jgi:hypothetical protein